MQELVVQYDGPSHGFDGFSSEPDRTNSPACPVAKGGKTVFCEFKVKVIHDMRPPILVDFVVDPFYQNHAVYLKSFSARELEGQVPPPADIQDVCTHPYTREIADGHRIFPCGLQATSLFNDTFEFWDADSWEPLLMDTSGISWNTDLQRLANPENYPHRHGFSWLFERFPGTISKSNGTRSEAFAVWLRAAASNRLQKPYGILQSALAAGESIVVRLNASFPVSDIGARKFLVLRTMGVLGGVQTGLSYFLLAAGVVCWGAALGVAAIRICCARRYGELRRRCVAVQNARGRDDSRTTQTTVTSVMEVPVAEVGSSLPLEGRTIGRPACRGGHETEP